MKYFNPVLSVVFILFIACFPLVASGGSFGQEEEVAQEEATAEEEEVVQEEAVEEEAVVEEEVVQEEAVVEEEAEEAVEEAIEEEEAVEEVPEEAVEEEVIEEMVIEEAVEAESPLAGFTAGFNIGLPIIKGSYLADHSGFDIGLSLVTPYSVAAGPLNIDLGVELFYTTFGDHFSGVAALGAANIGLNDLVPAELPVILTAKIGAGLIVKGAGVSVGGTIEYPVPNLPVKILLLGRGQLATNATEDNKPTYWGDGGLLVSYSF